MPNLSPLVNFERWTRACTDVGVASDEGDYRRVRRSWSGMGRHYHTLTHLEACLREFESAHALATRAGEVELALWFHDAIYRSWRQDNEQQSATLATRILRAASADCLDRIRQMVLATSHRDEDFTGDTALVLDIDLSILGQTPDIYAQFERAIRREYWWVPRAKYVAGRGAVLQKFLGRRAIYQHDHFYERYEKQARTNLAVTIDGLSSI